MAHVSALRSAVRCAFLSSVAFASGRPAVLNEWTGTYDNGPYSGDEQVLLQEARTRTHASARALAHGMRRIRNTLDSMGIAPLRPAVEDLVAERATLPPLEPLWQHLRQVVLAQRQRLAPQQSFEVLDADSDTQKAELTKAFDAAARPEKQGFSPVMKKGITDVKLIASCRHDSELGPLPKTFYEIWPRLRQGSVLVVPICSREAYDEAFVLLYGLNCEAAKRQPECNYKHQLGTGPPLKCEDFPTGRTLANYGLLPGFFVLETKTNYEKQLGLGDFYDTATLGVKSPTDKIIRHGYQRLYQRYLSTRRGSGGKLLEIGLGCNMKYGPGVSADLWRKYFPKKHMYFIDDDEQCVKKWRTHLDAANFTTLVGDQMQLKTNKEAGHMASPEGYEIVVDDGAHYNRAVKMSFQYLWPALAPGGVYAMEDIGAPAFSYLDCEPIQTVRHRQNTTALAKIVELGRPLALGEASDLVRLECQYEICALEKRTSQ